MNVLYYCQLSIYSLEKKEPFSPYLYINVFFTFYFSTSSFYQLCTFFYYSVVKKGIQVWLIYSASHCDIDENGVRHLVFCRVIMGNMELLRPGTRQFRPSSGDYDSGVDDIHNPRYYIVWNMNTNTHICPEYVVSFKVSSAAEGEILFLYFFYVFYFFTFS
jgi:hypothetical protein